MSELQHYYNDHDPAKGYDKLLFRASKGSQSREMNVMQEAFLQRTKGVSDVIFNDGDITEGCEARVNAETGETTITAGKLYLRGAIRDIDEATLNIAVDQPVFIGVWLEEKTITELEDPSLRDPAVGTRNYQEPGAARLQVNLAWGVATEENTNDFYPVHEVVNGVLKVKTPPPQLNAVTTALARYDRESNGSYVVNGLKLAYLKNDNGEQVYSLAEGKAHVDGYEVIMPTAVRLRYPIDADLQSVESEPHLFQPDGDGNMRIDVAHSPITSISTVDITEEKTVTITHGAYSGVKDPLPDNAILSIESVSQGTTEYVVGSDVKLTGTQADWSLSGDEPAPGSSYDITYQYRTQVDITDQDVEGFTVTGAVVGSLVMVDYDWALPRIDIITLDKDSNVSRVKGISHSYRPPVPTVPAGQLKLATITHDWQNEPNISNDAVRVIAMNNLEDMRDAIGDLYDLVAIERLKTDAVINEPAAKRGVFVDPFIDDDLRDQGIEQTAVIIDGELLMPIDAQVIELTADTSTLQHQHVTLLEQLSKTGEMKINPYQAFATVPAKVKLTPAVDRWTVRQTNWLSASTQRFVVTEASWHGGRTATTVRSATRVISRTRTDAVFELRPITISFSVDGFEPNEELEQVTFDGIAVEATA